MNINEEIKIEQFSTRADEKLSRSVQTSPLKTPAEVPNVF